MTLTQYVRNAENELRMGKKGFLASRPARPALCDAEDCVMSLVKSVSKPTGMLFNSMVWPLTTRHTRPGISRDVSFLLAFSGIDDILDPRYRNRCFCNVGCQDAFPHSFGNRCEHGALLTCR